ncbi:MAG: lytic transglycosylase domain-containing protein [Paracoccaceae bacterium]|nr:lytic transglycosylase domain-containing protein [Paracoccaceae bacterium]
MRKSSGPVAVVMLGACLAAPPVFAGGLDAAASPARLKIFQSQLRLMEGRLGQEYSFSDRLAPKSDLIVPRYHGNYRGKYLQAAKDAAAAHGVPQDLFLRLVQTESGWDPQAVSPKGAVGLAQLLPDTARLMGVDAADPRQNLDGGARYLKLMYDRYGTWRLAIAAYNAGPEAVSKHGGIPPYAETQNYVVAILGR